MSPIVSPPLPTMPISLFRSFVLLKGWCDGRFLTESVDVKRVLRESAADCAML